MVRKFALHTLLEVRVVSFVVLIPLVPLSSGRRCCRHVSTNVVDLNGIKP